MGLPVSDIESGSKSWSPQEIGDKIAGTILAINRKSQTDFTTGEPLTWSDGSPRLQTVIELQTDERADEDDDGIRTLWLKGGKNFEPQTGSGTSGEVALAAAAKEAGVKSIDEGGVLKFAFTGIAKPTTRGYQGAKLYQAHYTPPVQSVATDDLWD